MIYAGLDIGTTGSKITIFDDTEKKDRFYENYPSKRDANGHEIDASIIYETILHLIQKSVQAYPSLCAIGFTSFGETFVMLDKEDHILFPSMIYTDPRGEEEAKELETKIGKEKLGHIVGQIGQGMFSLPKLMYIKKHHPEIYQKADKVMLMEDYIIYMLTGKRQIDYALASRTLAFDVNTRSWSKEIFLAADIDSSLFSTPVPIGTSAGNIKEELKKQLKITHPLEIIHIAHDQIANALGAGVYEEGSAVDGLGTCECVTITFKGVPQSNILYEYGYGVIPYVRENYNVSYALISTGGALIDWVIQTYFKDLEDKDDCFSILNSKVKDEPTSVLVLPHFAGASTPYMDAHAKGAIINLDLSTSRYEIYQATLESLCYEMKLSLDLLEKAGIHIQKMYASGGGSKNDTWLQMKANIFNVPIYQLESIDTGTLGSAIVVGTALKLFNSYEEGMKKLIRVKKVFYPNQEQHETYLKIYQTYQKIYESMKGLRI